MMQLTFLGATGTVTGSKYLLEFAGKQVLIDCGLFQGFKELRLRNWQPFPFDPKKLDAVVLTHAHIDHSGALPLLMKQGYRGPIYSTHATRELCALLLPDSGHLQEEEAAYANKKGFSKHHPAEPLYTQADGVKVLEQFEAKAFGQNFSPVAELKVRYLPAGHILGAAMVEISYGKEKILFTGDLGRPVDPLMQPPVNVSHADILICESTYGNKTHPESNPLDELEKITNKTMQRQGVLLIPAFAVGRAQTLLHLFAQLKAQKRIPNVPIFLNSPMAIDATSLYHENAPLHRLNPAECEAMYRAATFVNEVEDSKELNFRTGPMIIIAASGMATGGRVVHHIRQFAPDPNNTILLVGFQAGGTRGAALAGGAKELKMFGQMIPINAELVQMNNLSAHADSNEMMDWLRHFHQAPRQTFLTHGEPEAASAFQKRIQDELQWNVKVPTYLEKVEL